MVKYNGREYFCLEFCLLLISDIKEDLDFVGKG